MVDQETADNEMDAIELHEQRMPYDQQIIEEAAAELGCDASEIDWPF